MNQKNIFLKYEGNNYFRRNEHNSIDHNIRFIENLIVKKFKKNNYLLEIGCGNGRLLNSLSKKKKFYSLWIGSFEESYSNFKKY